MTRESVVKPVAIMMMATFIGKCLIFVREMLIASFFGVSAQTDAFNVAISISTFILIGLVPLFDTFVPVYVGCLVKNEDKEAHDLLRSVGTILLVALGILSAIVYVFASQFVSLFAPGFSEANYQLTAQLVRMLSVFLILSGLISYVVAILTSHKDFLTIGLASSVGTVIAIGILWFLARDFGIRSLVYGIIVGSVVQLAILWASVRRHKINIRLSFKVHEGLKVLGKLFVLMLLARYIGQIITIVDQNMVSRLGEGSIAALRFAQNIYMLPFEVFTLGITTVVITYFSWSVAKGNADDLKRDLSLSIRIAAFFLIPVMVGLIVLRYPIVRVFYERGKFGSADTEATAVALLFYACGMFSRAIDFIAGQLFLSQKNVLLFLYITLVVVAFHVLFNFIFIDVLAHTGVALSATLAESIMALVALGIIRKQLGPLGGRYILKSLVKVGGASSLMGGTLLVVMRFIYPRYELFNMQTVQLSISIPLGFLVYIGVLYLIRLDEVRSMWTVLVKRSRLAMGIP